MKKITLSGMLLMLSLAVFTAALTACAAPAPVAPTEAPVASSEPVTPEPEPETEPEPSIPAAVMPLNPLEDAQDALEDGVYPVSFSAGDLAKEDSGLVLTVEVFGYDRYAKAAIDALAVGGRIRICGEEREVTAIERDPQFGDVIINGDIRLMAQEDEYRTTGENDHPMYFSVGKVAIPLSAEAVFTDKSDPEAAPDGVVFGYDEIPGAIRDGAQDFSCYNTTITVRDGSIVELIRRWIP
ncbi:MAG: hypothetical protein ACI4XW_06120 [Candidatus Spyradocola sp.]